MGLAAMVKADVVVGPLVRMEGRAESSGFVKVKV